MPPRKRIKKTKIQEPKTDAVGPDAVMPQSDPSVPSTSIDSSKQFASCSKSEAGIKKRRISESDLTERARKRIAKAEEDEQCNSFLHSLIEGLARCSSQPGHSSCSTQPAPSSVAPFHLLLPSAYKDKVFNLTVTYLETNIRLDCSENEKFSGLYEDVGKFFNLDTGAFYLTYNGKNITESDTPNNVGMPDRAKIGCILIPVPQVSTVNDGTDD